MHGTVTRDSRIKGGSFEKNCPWEKMQTHCEFKAQQRPVYGSQVTPGLEVMWSKVITVKGNKINTTYKYRSEIQQLLPIKKRT